jgi:hypothetical protein
VKDNGPTASELHGTHIRTCIAAGVDPRFKLAVPVYGCGFYRDTLFERNLSQLSPDLADRWMASWDPSSYLGASHMPFLWAAQSDGRVTAALPPGTRVYFFNLFDQRDCVVSTEHQELGVP